MELKKRKFKRDEVEQIISQLNSNYSNKLDEYSTLITELKEENSKLQFELNNFKENENLISSSIKNAEKKAQETNLVLDKKIKAEITVLKDFHQKWSEYFKSVFEKYPLYPVVKEMNKISNEINTILDDEKLENKKKIQKIDKLIPKNKAKTFNPMKKIEDYVVATSDNGFNLDEVLNPGELKLEDICKELGLIE